MRTTSVILASIGALHCGPSEVLHVPFPPIDAGSMVIAIDQTTGTPQFVVQAVDVLGAQSERLPSVPIERGENVTIDVLLYPSSLLDLNLPAGPLVAADNSAPVRALPPSVDVFRLELPDDDPVWTKVDEPNDRLQRLRIVDPGPRGCATLVSEPFSLPDETETEFAVALGPDEVLISQQSGQLLRWTPTALEVVQVTPEVALSHGVWDDVDGGWWFMTRRGLLYRGSFDTATSLSLRLYAQNAPVLSTGRHRIVLRHEGGEPRIYSVSANGFFQRFQASGPTTLHKFDDAGFGQQAVLTPEGEVVAASSGSARAAVVDLDGRLEIETVPSEAGFTASGYVDGIGTVLGSSDGRFFARRNGGWTELGRSPLEVFPYAISPYAGGFIFAGAFGAGGQYLPEGYCALQDQLAAFTIRTLVKVTDGLLAFGQNPNVPNTPAQLIRFNP